MPNGSCSPSYHPAPSPMTKRPPVAWSSTVADFARSTGCRNVFESTAWPTRTPGTWWTSVARSEMASSDGPGTSGSMSVRWSFIHAPSQPPCWPASSQVASSVAQSTRWGEVLNEIRRATALADVAGAGREGPTERVPVGDGALGGGGHERGVLRHHARRVVRRGRRPAGPPLGEDRFVDLEVELLRVDV